MKIIYWVWSLINHLRNTEVKERPLHCLGTLQLLKQAQIHVDTHTLFFLSLLFFNSSSIFSQRAFLTCVCELLLWNFSFTSSESFLLSRALAFRDLGNVMVLLAHMIPRFCWGLLCLSLSSTDLRHKDGGRGSTLAYNYIDFMTKT